MLLPFVERLLARWPGFVGLRGADQVALRASLAALVSFGLAMLCGPRLIRWLTARFPEPIKSASARVALLHQSKQATPTMGGIFIVTAIVISTVALTNVSNPYVPIAIVLAVGLGLLGACDDLMKLTTASRGLSASKKLGAQTLLALVVALLIYRVHDAAGGELALPLIGESPGFAWLLVPFWMLAIVGASNAVNLADGLDGLAGGCLVCATAGMGVVTYASGHAEWARYLGIVHIQGAGEVVVLAGGMLGALLGFLWFNCHPASVFMGNVGSLPLGGLLGLLAIVSRQELLLVVVGGVFVVETCSVIAQVAFYRWRRRRVLLCAPLHNHFQFMGWPEDKIVVRFWIAGALCVVAALAGLKLRASELPDAVQVQANQQAAR